MSTGVAARPAVRSLSPWPQDRPLRAWQNAALEALAAHSGNSFLASATPAAGKTTFGLKVAHEMLRSGKVQRVVVAAPTTHICRQWAADAARYGIDLEPNRPNSEGREPRDRHGVAVTYQTIAAGPAHARGRLHARHAADRRRAAPHGRARRMGIARAAGLRRGQPAPAALGHPVPLRLERDPVGHLRRRRASAAPTTRTATRRRCSTASAARSPSSPTTARWSG